MINLDIEQMAVEYVRNGRKRGLEDGAIMNMNAFMKKVRPEIYTDFKFVDFTVELHNVLMPPAEDVYKDNSWRERLDDLYRSFEKSRTMMLDFAKAGMNRGLFEPTKALPIIEFDLTFSTHVKDKVSAVEFDTYKFSKKVDRTIKIYVQPMLDENLQRGLLFGLLIDK